MQRRMSQSLSEKGVAVFTDAQVLSQKLSQLDTTDDHDFVPKLPGDESSDEDIDEARCIEARGRKRTAEEPVDDLRKENLKLNHAIAKMESELNEARNLIQQLTTVGIF